MRSERETKAMAVVRRYMAISAGAALIPFAVVDVAALAGVHISLIKEICDRYGVEFSEHTARNILIAIMAGLVPASFGSVIGRKVLRILPWATHAVGLAAMAAFSAGVSYVIGRIFIRHFETGGTLLDFNIEHLHDLLSEFRRERHMPAASA